MVSITQAGRSLPSISMVIRTTTCTPPLTSWALITSPPPLTRATTPVGTHEGYMPGFGNDFETEALPGALREHEYGMGAAAADFDNDGSVDLYVLNLGPNELWRNRGDGTFEDVTESSGAGDTGYGQGLACGDYDNDGFVDLYVANVGGPSALLHNNGDGTFTNVTDRAGVGKGTVYRYFGNKEDLFWATYELEHQLYGAESYGRFGWALDLTDTALAVGAPFARRDAG